MDAVDAVGQKVGNLVDGIGDADVVHGVGFVAVFGNGPLEFDGQGGAAHGDHVFDLALVGNRHDARFDGHLDAGDFTAFAEAVKYGIVEKHLGNQFAGTGIDLGLEVSDVGNDGLGFGMAFGIAGASDVEFRLFFLNEGDEVAGMFKAMGPFSSRRFVAAKGQDVFDSPCFQLF